MVVLRASVKESIKQMLSALQFRQFKRADLMGLALLNCLLARAQQKYLHNEIGVSYTSMRFQPHDQYLGAGVDYRYFFRSWIGVEAQAGDYPEYQQSVSPDVGYQIKQFDGCALVGHRWGKVSLLGEAGFGVIRPLSFGGYTSTGGGIYPTRNYPDFLMGGMVAVSLGRRWSITYEVPLLSGYKLNRISWLGFSIFAFV